MYTWSVISDWSHSDITFQQVQQAGAHRLKSGWANKSVLIVSAAIILKGSVYMGSVDFFQDKAGLWVKIYVYP